MTKNLLAIAVAAALTVPFAAANASSHGGAEAKAAEVTVGGSARFRYGNYDFDAATGGIANAASKAATNGTGDYVDNRVRLNVTAKMDGGVKVFAQIEADDDNTGTNDDQAYMVVPMGPVTVTAGDQPAAFGAKFKVNTNVNDRVKIAGKLGDVNIAGLLDEGNNDGIVVSGGFGDVKLALVHKPSIEWTDVFVGAKVGPVNIALEHSKGMDAADAAAAGGNAVTAAKFQGTGTLVQLTMGVADMTAILAVVQTEEGFKADDDFAPITTLGTGTHLGAMNVGDNGDWTTTLIGLTGKADAITWKVMLGTTEIDTGAADPVEVSITDVSGSYGIAKGTSLNLSWGNLGGDVDYTAGGMSLTTKF